MNNNSALVAFCASQLHFNVGNYLHLLYNLDTADCNQVKRFPMAYELTVNSTGQPTITSLMLKADWDRANNLMRKLLTTTGCDLVKV